MEMKLHVKEQHRCMCKFRRTQLHIQFKDILSKLFNRVHKMSEISAHNKILGMVTLSLTQAKGMHFILESVDVAKQILTDQLS